MEHVTPDNTNPYAALSLRGLQDQLVQITDLLPVLVGYLDTQQIYRYANKCHERWFGVAINQIEGHHISEVIGFDEYQTVLPYIEAALIGKHADFEMQMHHKGIGAIFVRVSYIPDKDKDNNVRGVSLLVEDITKLKHEAETAIYAKNAFLATMSHEIRTPLNGILGMTELLFRTELSERQHKYANTIYNSGEGLLTIINDILDFCKIEAGELEIESNFFNIKEVAQEVLQTLMPKALEKGNTLKLHFTAGTPSNAVGDPVRVRQLLSNLISNAIKFTSHGAIDVSIRNQGRTDKGIKFLCEVKDTGIGISPEKMDHIFDKFAAADGHNTRKFGGAGLGLAICHKIATLMGGSIGVESQEGKGTTFWFTLCLPAEEVALATLDEGNGIVTVTAPAVNAIKGREKEWVTFKGVHILLVEDDVLNQQMAVSMLETMKCRVSIASNGREAIRLMGQEDTFDLILMDCEMPELNGYEATKIIKQNSTIPIIAMTASVMRGDKSHCFEAGMDDFLPKPIKHEELEKKLLKWVAEEKLAKTG